MQIKGYLYQAKSSRKENAELVVDAEGNLTLPGYEIEPASVNDVKISERIGMAARYMDFPSGHRFETNDNDQIDELERRFGHNNGYRFVHFLESNRKAVLYSLVAVVLFSWVVIGLVIPAGSRSLAFALPLESNQKIADGVLDILDKSIFQPSKLSAEKRLDARQIFDRVIAQAGDEFEFSLHLRKGGKIGANAFALPAGQIVLTDELVSIVENDYELEGIIAHEVGHVTERHALRSILQNSLSAFLLSALTGDILSSANFVAAIPVLLVESKYSRTFEMESDMYAKRYMQKNGISLDYYASILERISDDKDEEGMPILSSHPATAERIQLFRSQN